MAKYKAKFTLIERYMMLQNDAQAKAEAPDILEVLDDAMKALDVMTDRAESSEHNFGLLCEDVKDKDKEIAGLRKALEKIADETAATWVCDVARDALKGRYLK